MLVVRFVLPLFGNLHTLQVLRSRCQQPARYFLVERLDALAASLLAAEGLRLLAALTHGDFELLGQLAARTIFGILRGQRAALTTQIKRLRVLPALAVDPVRPATLVVRRAGTGGGEQA
jgi:hypothetical protein